MLGGAGGALGWRGARAQGRRVSVSDKSQREIGRRLLSVLAGGLPGRPGRAIGQTPAEVSAAMGDPAS